jgi:hypothetical protein
MLNVRDLLAEIIAELREALATLNWIASFASPVRKLEQLASAMQVLYPMDAPRVDRIVANLRVGQTLAAHDADVLYGYAKAGAAELKWLRDQLADAENAA